MIPFSTTLRNSLFLACLAILWLLSLPTPAQAQAGVTLTAEAGFDSYCKENHWIPVRITLENNGPDLQGRVEARLPGMGANEEVYSQPVSLGTISRKQVELDVFLTGYVSQLDVSLYSQDKLVAETTVRLSCLRGSGDLLFGVISDTPSAFNILTNLKPANGEARMAQIDLAALPHQPHDLQSLDMLFVAGVDTGPLSPEQQAALSGWLSSGGRLVIAGGSAWQKTSAGLRDFLPIQVQASKNLSDLSSLVAYTASDQPLSEQAIVATGTLTASGKILAKQDGLPLIVQRTYGAGSVYFLAFDPSTSPVKNWDGLEALYRQINTKQSSLPGWSQGLQDWNMAAQAASALPNVDLPSGFLICGFLGIYILAIGPLNYLILRRRKRKELAWISIPALVILFSGLAFILGSQTRGSKPVLNRLSIVQVQPGTPQSQVDGVVGVFSPNRATYQVEFGPGLLAHPMPNTMGLSSSTPSIVEDGDKATIDGLRVDVGGIEPVAFSGEVQTPAFTSSLELFTDGGNNRLEGTVTNQSSLTLRDAVLLAPGAAQSLGSLKPGESRDVSLLLDKAQYSDQSGNPYPQVFGAPGQVYVPPSSYPYYGSDSTIEDIIGNPNYYNSKENYRRYALLSSALNSNQGSSGRGGGVYLSGWSDSLPTGMKLSLGGNRRFSSIDTSLYLISLQPKTQYDQSRMTLGPGLFTWSVLESSPIDKTSPYDSYLPTGSFSLQFRLAQPVTYGTIQSLILHLMSNSTANPNQFVISLWDYQTQDWSKQEIQSFGDIEIPEPDRYVGKEGEIRLRIALAGSASQNIQRADFTLQVAP